MRRLAGLGRNPLRRAYAFLEARKLKAWERRVNGRAQLAMVCSETDRELLARLCPSTWIAVVPNTIEVETYSPAPEGEAGRLVFTGTMNWIPNQDALVFFADYILPELQRLIPGVRFVAAGRPPAEEFRRRFVGRPVHFTGVVPDMRTELARASVCVVPLRVGSGTRFKILEAAAMAKPIVSTRLGAEGLDFIPGQEIILEDDARRFARAVAELLNDPARRLTLGQAARRRVERQYTFPVLCAALKRALEEAFQPRLETTL